MNVKRTTNKRSYTMYGTIYLRASGFDLYENDPIRVAEVEHEHIHIIRQGGWFKCSTWLLSYFTDRNFRRVEESIAFARQFRSLYDHGLSLDVGGIKNSMVSGYWGAFTPDTAADVINAAIDKTELFNIKWWEL